MEFEPHQLVKCIELTTEADFRLLDAEMHVQFNKSLSKTHN